MAVHRYQVKTLTGSDEYAGTDAGVYFTLFGTRGQTPEFLHDTPGDSHQPNAVDEVPIDWEDLGDLTKVYIRHDNRIPNPGDEMPGWQLEYVEVKKITCNRLWHFPCKGWLATARPPHRIDAVLTPAGRIF